MFDKPRISRHYYIHPFGKSKFLLLSERDQILLHDPIYASLIPLLDGRNSVDEIAERLRGVAEPLEIVVALSALQEKNLLDSTIPTLEEADLRFWNSAGVESLPGDIRENLSRLPISIVSFGGFETNDLATLLSRATTKVAPTNAAFTIVITSDYLHPELDAWNRSMLAGKRSWIVVKPSGMQPWIGPLFDPSGSACWECVAQRLRWNRQLELAIQSFIHNNAPLLPAHREAATESVTFPILIAELAKHFAGIRDTKLAENLLVLDLKERLVESHRVIKRPQCPVCGKRADALEKSKPLFLSSGHRICPPAETLRRYGKHVSPFTGVVRELRRLPSEVTSLPLYAAGHARKQFSTDLETLLEERHLINAGKGTTDIAARASALGEAIERYCAFFQGNELRIVSSYTELGSHAIHPHTLLNFSETQYRNRDIWNRAAHPRCRIPLPFDEEDKIEWTPVWSLTTRQFRYVPTAYCYFGYPQNRELAFCEADSNGNAAGNSIEEAILQGFLELIERDSVAIWWYNKIHRPAIDLNSFEEPWIRELQEFFSLHNGEFWILDLTGDFGIPVFASVSRTFRGGEEKLSLGFGAHLEARAAVFRALTEMNQVQPYLLSEKGRRENPIVSSWWKQIRTDRLPFLLANNGVAAKKASDFPAIARNDLRDEVNFCVEIAQAHDLEVFVLDQTQPDIEMPVVKVMSPGLRPMLPRFGKGRLYDVPVKEGWLDHPLLESQFNELPFLL